MKFICLAYEAQTDLDALSRDQWAALRKETMDYVEKLRADGHLLDARPLRSASTAVTVRVRNERLATIDGPFAEAKEQIGGYFLLEARDLDEAIALASGWPSARFGAIEVRPIDEELREDRRYG